LKTLISNWYSPQSRCPSRTLWAPFSKEPQQSWWEECRAPSRGEPAGPSASVPRQQRSQAGLCHTLEGNKTSKTQLFRYSSAQEQL